MTQPNEESTWTKEEIYECADKLAHLIATKQFDDPLFQTFLGKSAQFGYDMSVKDQEFVARLTPEQWAKIQKSAKDVENA